MEKLFNIIENGSNQSHIIVTRWIEWARIIFKMTLEWFATAYALFIRSHSLWETQRIKLSRGRYDFNVNYWYCAYYYMILFHDSQTHQSQLSRILSNFELFVASLINDIPLQWSNQSGIEKAFSLSRYDVYATKKKQSSEKENSKLNILLSKCQSYLRANNQINFHSKWWTIEEFFVCLVEIVKSDPERDRKKGTVAIWRWLSHHYVEIT